MTILSEIVCVMIVRISLASRLSHALVHFVTDLASLFADHRDVGSSNSCQIQAFQDNLRANFWQFSDWLKFLLFELMIIQTRSYDFIKLLHFLVCQFAVSFNAFLSMSFHVVGPRQRLCVRFLPPGNFTVAPAEIRDSNILLCCSMIVSFGLHSRWVHPKYTRGQEMM